MSKCAVCGWAAAWGLLLISQAWAAEEAEANAAAGGSREERILAEKSPAIVTIKFVLKAGNSDSSGEDSENEVTGVMIDPKGLVLCSNMQLTQFSAFDPQMMGRRAATPTDIKVLVGDDTQGLKAKVLAKDRELDLAWVQIEEPGDKPLVYVDLSKSIKGKIGARVFSVRRMGKYFDRVATIREAQISGMTRKPRELYALGGSLNADFGLPVFAASGEILGVTILPISDREELASGNPMAMLGGISGILDMFGGLVLPAEEVVKATKRAREHPQTQPAEPVKKQESQRKR